MQAAGLVFSQLLFFTFFGGTMGLPLGLPPGPEDPTINRAAPERCLLYASWAGMAAPDAKSPNKTEQLLAEPEVQQFASQLETWVRSAARSEAAKKDRRQAEAVDDVADWIKLLLTRPAALFLADVTGTPEKPEARGGLIVAVGPDAPKVKDAIQRRQKEFLQAPVKVESVQIAGETWHRIKFEADGPTITWGFHGTYFVAAIGEGTVEGILFRMEKAKEPPAWLSAIVKRLPVQRRCTLNYVNVKGMMEKIQAMAAMAQAKPKEKTAGRRPQVSPGPAEIKMWIEIFGLDNVQSVAEVTGLDGEGYVARTLMAMDGEPRGILRLVSQRPLRAEDIAPIPRDAMVAMAFRLDLQQVLDTVLSAADKLGPDTREGMDRGMEMMQQFLGLDLRHGLLRSLGDSWCLYNSPGEGGFSFINWTAAVPIRDRASLTATYGALMTRAKRFLAPEEGEGPGRSMPRLQQYRFANQDIGFVNAFLVSPAWCMAERELVLGLFPQNVKAYLTRPAGRPGLAERPEVKKVLAQSPGPIMLAYYDTPKIVEGIYSMVPMYATVLSSVGAMGPGAPQLPSFNMAVIPSAPAITRHLRPGVSSMHRVQDGIELTHRQTLPVSTVGPAVSMAAAAALAVGTQSRSFDAPKAKVGVKTVPDEKSEEEEESLPAKKSPKAKLRPAPLPAEPE